MLTKDAQKDRPQWRHIQNFLSSSPGPCQQLNHDMIIDYEVRNSVVLSCTTSLSWSNSTLESLGVFTSNTRELPRCLRGSRSRGASGSVVYALQSIGHVQMFTLLSHHNSKPLGRVSTCRNVFGKKWFVLHCTRETRDKLERSGWVWDTAISRSSSTVNGPCPCA